MDDPSSHYLDGRLLRMPEVKALTGLRSSRIYELMQKDAFPRQIKVVGSSHWCLGEIQKWIADRKWERDREIA